MLGEPQTFMNHLNQLPPKPWVKSATASGPCCAFTLSSPSPTLLSAASQETSSKTSSPRFEVRMSGRLSRSGS